MSSYIWADLKDKTLAKAVKEKTKYISPCNLSGEIWSWNKSYDAEALEYALKLKPAYYDKDKNEVINEPTIKTLGEMQSFISVAREVIKRIDNIEELIRMFIINPDCAHNYWYQEISHSEPSHNLIDEDDLEKYNDIDNPEIAKAIRTADLEYNDKILNENKELRQRFVTRMNNICVVHGGDDGDLLLDCLIHTSTEFMAFITLASTLMALNEVADDDTEIMFSMSC